MTTLRPCYICGVSSSGIKLNGVQVCGTCITEHFPQEAKNNKVVPERDDVLDLEKLDLELDLTDWLAEQDTSPYSTKQ